MEHEQDALEKLGWKKDNKTFFHYATYKLGNFEINIELQTLDIWKTLEGHYTHFKGSEILALAEVIKEMEKQKK